MTVRVLRYSVGNEHDPGDPWGRSELVIDQDGTARMDRPRRDGRSWGAVGGPRTGRVPVRTRHTAHARSVRTQARRRDRRRDRAGVHRIPPGVGTVRLRRGVRHPGRHHPAV